MQPLLMQHRVHLVLQPRPLPHQRRPQPHLLPPRLRLPVRLPRLRQQIAAQQMRQRRRIHPVRSSVWPRQSPSPAADAPAPTASPPALPPRETPARSRTPPPPPPLPAPETAENTAAKPASRSSPAPPVKSSLLLPAPSCNKISGEDLLQRGSSRASFRACASSTYSTLGVTPFLFSLHLSGPGSARSAVLAEPKDPYSSGKGTT